MPKDLSKVKLNKEQMEAVNHGEGPLLIIAGAGTGKTTVITERIKYLIQSELAKPSEILALTFTEKAAREMEERVDQIMPYGYTQMWMMTFHSFCDRILRDSALNIGMDTKYKLMTQSETIQFIRKHLFDFELQYFRPLGNPNKFVEGMVSHFSRLQDEDVSPDDYQKWANTQLVTRNKLTEEQKLELEKWQELAKAYKKYNELKTKESFVDFGELITKTLQLFRERPNILANYQKTFKYVLVDEFQDTNISQNELVKLLVGDSGRITVVLDDDQSIYRFRGAAVSNALHFRKSFPDAKIITLTKNYRSNQEILDKAYTLIQNNNPDRLEVIEKIDKKLISQAVETSDVNTPRVSFIHTGRVENEAESVAREIQSLVSSRQSLANDQRLMTNSLQYGDIAILVRANNHAEPFVKALTRAGIPCQFLGPGRLFKQPEIIDLISYLKVLYDFDDSISFYRVLSMENFAIDDKDLIKLTNHARKENLSLFEASESIENLPISEDSKEKIGSVIDLVNKHISLTKKESAGQILYYFLLETGLLSSFINPDTQDAEKRANNIAKFFDKLKSYEVDHEDSAVPAIVDWIELSSELGESPLAADFDWSNSDAVSILSVHSSKGLEFPVVFLVNLVSQRFPTIERREQIPIPEELIKEVLPKGDYHIEEERRLFYVGMTRAKNRLYLTAADYYGEGKREKRLSPFIFEALGEEATGSEKLDVRSEQLSFLNYQSSAKGLTTNDQKLTTGFHIDYLSYSQIESFKICPLHYKLNYIYRIPTPASASQSFGITIHATLKRFYEQIKEGKKASNKLIYKIFENEWINKGFISKSHEKEFYEKGKDYLAGFIVSNFDKKNIPILMEQKFNLPLELAGKSIKIGGTMDRVDKLSSGILEIVDYKTGATIPTQSEVDKNLQLSIYALAATTLIEDPFGKNPEDVKLSLYFLDQQEKISTIRTKAQLKEAVNEIFKYKEEIESSDFRCSGHMFCLNNCEYSLFCKSDQE